MLDQIYITNQLDHRTTEPANFLSEKIALQELATQMSEDPEGILPKFVDLAIEMTRSVAGGISILEGDPKPGKFRWHHLRGVLAQFSGATTPRNYSPCGIVLDKSTPILVQRPERQYDWLVEANVSLPECLLVPIFEKGEIPYGTLWVVSKEEGHFNRSHARILSELSAFTGIALNIANTETRLRKALKNQTMISKEMEHRVKNVFAMSQAMILQCARHAETPRQLARDVSDRLAALAQAHTYITDSSREMVSQIKGETFKTFLRSFLDPHATPDHCARVKLSGPEIELGKSNISNFAMIFHELATNAAKYGALSSEDGVVSVEWQIENDNIVLNWQEIGGPLIQGIPEYQGFGSILVQKAIANCSGEIKYEWPQNGLHVQIIASVELLAM